ncbi:MAG TPA: hypothetical protein VKA85_09605 [Candidatus Limnocylindrales bacterium]|nr:hypothetical protein [Candidatus Limnocylindrales bacterium]
MGNGTSQGTALLHCFPHDDVRLRDAAEELVRSDAVAEPRDLERSLRATYPNVVVRGQHPLAAMTGDTAVWYVFRDGSYVPDDTSPDAAD